MLRTTSVRCSRAALELRGRGSLYDIFISEQNFRTWPVLRLSESRPKAEVHGVICLHLIEYFVIPASPQSAAAAGLNVFSDIRNCLGR